MREIIVPPLVPSDGNRNLTELVVRNAREAPSDPVFSRRDGEAGWRDVSCATFLGEVTAVAKGLIAAGVGAGDRIGLMCRTRYEWTLFDFAIWFAGAITVPIYETSSVEQMRWILADSGAAGCVVESTALGATVGSVRDQLPDLRGVWVVDEGAVDQLGAAGAAVGDELVESRCSSLGRESIATIIYTSGTTGRPKGCELTHANFLAMAHASTHEFGSIVAPGRSTLLFLPLAHVFARYIQVLCVANRARLAHGTPATLLDDLPAFRPTFLLAVPRVFEKIYNGAEAKAETSGRGRVFRAAARVAVGYSEAQERHGPGATLRLRHAVFDRLVYRRLRELTGGRVEAAVCGGAPLGVRLGHFFRGVGIPVLEGWGLTETTAPATVNSFRAIRIGTVGRPLPGVGVRTGEDGELMVRGLNVMAGYHHDPGATAEALRDGWFGTGDVGEIDDDGFVRITGRKKEIIVTAGGKNVAPAVLEDRLRAHPLVSQCMVVGDQRPFIACLITLDSQLLPGWLAARGLPAMRVPEAARNDRVLGELQAAVDDVNTLVSKAESIRRFAVLDVDWTEEDGQLTPKQSLRRHVVSKEFAQDIDRLYR